MRIGWVESQGLIDPVQFSQLIDPVQFSQITVPRRGLYIKCSVFILGLTHTQRNLKM